MSKDSPFLPFDFLVVAGCFLGSAVPMSTTLSIEDFTTLALICSSDIISPFSLYVFLVIICCVPFLPS